MNKLQPLKIRREGYQYTPVLDRTPSHQTIRERAEFLAHEIFADRLAPEEEIADAIETEIHRFARRASSTEGQQP